MKNFILLKIDKILNQIKNYFESSDNFFIRFLISLIFILVPGIFIGIFMIFFPRILFILYVFLTLILFIFIISKLKR